VRRVFWPSVASSARYTYEGTEYTRNMRYWRCRKRDHPSRAGVRHLCSPFTVEGEGIDDFDVEQNGAKGVTVERVSLDAFANSTSARSGPAISGYAVTSRMFSPPPTSSALEIR
jgi:hypothetical protein